MSRERHSEGVATDSTRSYSRRTLLGTICGAGLAGLAGCGGGGSETETEADDSAGSGETPADGGSTPAGGGETQASGSCPSPPFSYTRQEVTTVGGGEPLVSISVPDESFVELRDSGMGLFVELDSSTLAGFEVIVTERPDDSIDDRVTEEIEGTTLTEVTDEYDFPEGTRVVQEEFDPMSGSNTYVYFPMSGGGVLTVSITRTGTDWCPEAYDAASQRLVESIQRV